MITAYPFVVLSGRDVAKGQSAYMGPQFHPSIVE